MNKVKGFTLLEVIVSLTIVALVLGTVFSLLAGSKRLAFKAINEIEQSVFSRAAINAAQVLENPDYPKFTERYDLTLTIDESLEKPERQTRPMRLALEPYSWRNETKGITFNTVRLILRETAQ
jgi:general secretion pathway protein I